MNVGEIGTYLELKEATVVDKLISLNGCVFGALGDTLKEYRDKSGMYEKSFLDIGILRMPDIDKPGVMVSPSLYR